MLLDLPVSMHWVTTSYKTLFPDWSKNEYVKDLALCPGLPYLPSRINYSTFLLHLMLHPVHLAMPHLQHPKDMYLECNNKPILMQIE